MITTIKLATAAALVSATFILSPFARAQSTNILDASGDVFTTAGGGILDITSVEVANNAFDLVFTIHLAGNPVAADWGKYMIAFDTVPGGDPTGNGWARPISMSSGMDYWVGAWVDGGNGGQVWTHSVAWSQTGSASVTKTTSNVTVAFPFAALGLSPGDTFEFDVYTSGGGGDGAIDALSNPSQTVAIWGGPYDSMLKSSHTIANVPAQTNRVTFTVNMTNATGTDATVYDAATRVFINGNFTGWDLNEGDGDWGATPRAELEMTRIGDSSLHTITLPIPPGHPLRLVYKFSMNGFDNEAGFAMDHVGYIRAAPGQIAHTMPLDTWIGTNTVALANREEARFGNLRAAPAGPGQVSLAWDGLKCVSLQSSTGLSGFVTDTNTAGLSSTNVAT
ncbi:MAG TPA: hypothetical protein VLL76_02480, partial [Candidatus Omnitrophota bacterium]|nr:hypothetical protein [Candidatus Omnitrophota bacterium]